MRIARRLRLLHDPMSNLTFNPAAALNGVDARVRAKPPHPALGESLELWAATDDPVARCALSAGLADGVALRAALVCRLRDGPPAPIGISPVISALYRCSAGCSCREPPEFHYSDCPNHQLKMFGAAPASWVTGGEPSKQLP